MNFKTISIILVILLAGLTFIGSSFANNTEDYLLDDIESGSTSNINSDLVIGDNCESSYLENYKYDQSGSFADCGVVEVSKRDSSVVGGFNLDSSSDVESHVFDSSDEIGCRDIYLGSSIETNCTDILDPSNNIASDKYFGIVNITNINSNELCDKIYKSENDYITKLNIVSDDDLNSKIISLSATPKVWLVTTHTFAGIQEAINNASDGDTILLENATYVGSGNFISCRKRLNFISSKGATLDSKGKSCILRYYEVSSGNINIENITFVNGFIEGDGSAFITSQNLINPIYLTVTNCCFKNNKGKDEKLGAAFVAKECANVKINNCSFIENSNLAQSWYVSGAAIRITCSESNYFSLITNCTFINNSNEIGSGIVEVRMDATISNCSFIDNYVGGAGVLQVGGSNKSSIILDCIFKNNEVLEHGAICTLWDSLISNCTFIDNYAHKYGGAICNHYNTDVVDCIFINNSAGRGGAITTGFENTVSSWLVNINSSYFENNSAIEDGGAILARYVNIEDKVFINNCSFINNSAKDGGAINLVVESCKCSDSIFINNSAKDRGGAIFILGNNTFINNLNLTSNNASYGGGVYIEGSETEVNNILFIDNHANPIVDTPYNDSRMDDGLGGAAFLNGENIVVMNSILYNNTARNGSGFYLRGINMSLNNVSDLSPNQAWSYLLPINITGSKDFINFNITHIGGNNINRANKGNFIYLNASNDNLIMDGEIPVDGVENSNNGALLFKDTCEQNQTLYWIILDDSNKEYLSGYDVSDLYGSISLDFNTSLFKPNVLYTFKVYHLGEDYYTYIDNFTYFTNPVPIVSKTTKESFEFVGEVFNYTIAINNIAPLDSDFIVTDYLPDNFVYQGNDCMDKCIMLDLENHKITWNISVSANSTYYITLWGYSNKSNIVLNNFVKISNDFGFEVNDTHTIPVYSKANLTIDKTVDVSSEINKGDIVNWTITVFNYGPNSASDVVISDLIDNETMRIIEVNDTRYNKSSGKIYLGDLDKNSSFSFIITTEVIKSNIVIINVANVISSSYNECNETIDLNDSAFIDVLPQANLDVIESVNVSGPVNIGDLLTFSISVVNDGPDSACDVIITDLLDSSVFSFISCNDSRYDNYTGEFKLDEMKSGEVLNFDVVVEVTKSNINVANDVNVFSPTNSSLGFANNVSDSIIVNVLPQANLRINQSANSTVLDVGDNVTFIINVFNDGPDTASNVLITDILNNSYLKIKGSNNTSYNISSGKLELGDLEANDNISFEIYAQVIKSNKNVTNLVNAFSPTNNKYRVANNVSNNLTITILPVANIKISKSSNVHKAKVGDSIVWTIAVKNNGPDTAKTVFCVDKLPKGLKFINYISCLDDDFDIGYYDPFSGEWVIGDMDCGSIAILTIFTKAIKSGNFTNIVGVHSDTYNPDGDIVYDNASVEITKKEFSKNKSSNVPSLVHDAKTLESKELKYSNNQLSHKSNNVKMINTGNPMLILFVSMIACCLLSLRRKI